MNDVAPRALPSRQDVQVMQTSFDAALDYYTPQIADALPDHIPLARFKRVLVTAIHQDRDLYTADRQSLFNACVKCAQDGLYPDGREAVLKVFNTKVKRTDDKGIEREVSVPLVTYMPMIAGIRKRMRNSGDVLSAIAEVVYRNDKFRYLKGEEARIEHEPAALDADRGDPVGAYAIIRLTNGETLREVMGAHEIEQIRKQFSRGSDGTRSPWTTSRSEMWRKTVLRRCAKAAPMDSDMRQVFERDDEVPQLPPNRDITLPPPRPTREQFNATVDEPADEPHIPLYELINCDHEKVICTADTIEENLMAILAEAQRRGPQVVEAALDNNEEIVLQIEAGDIEVGPQVTIEIAQMRRIVRAEQDAAMAEEDPTPAAANDPESKPSEARREAADEARSSSEAKAGATVAGSGDRPERRPQPQQNPAGHPRGRPPASAPPSTDDLAAIVAAADPPEAAPQEDADYSYTLPPVFERDQQTIAYAAWWAGRFLNALRSAKTPDDIAQYVGSNGEMIQGYYATLPPAAKIAAMKELDEIKKEKIK